MRVLGLRGLGERPPPPPADCGDGFCSWLPGDDCFTCPQDCGACPPPPTCGDGICSGGPGDDCFTCPGDCGDCPPPPVCGDAVCEPGEWCESCPSDCGSCPPPVVCADGVCDIGENCTNCGSDCGACADCSHDECTQGPSLGYPCTPCVTAVCDVDAFCCSASGSWDAICVLEAGAACGIACGL